MKVYRSNSPIVRYPIPWARVMGERPSTWVGSADLITRDNPAHHAACVKTCDVMTKDKRIERRILPAQVRRGAPAALFRVDHAHYAACGEHVVHCDATPNGVCETLDRRRRPACITCGVR